MYPPLPVPPAQLDSESGGAYAGRLLVYLLQADDCSACLPAMSDRQLDSAHHATHNALCMRNVLGVGDDAASTPACVYNRLAAVLGLLRQAIDRRESLRLADLAHVDQLGSTPPDSHPTGGRLTPLQPTPPDLPPETVSLPLQPAAIRF